jgi:hypothetical protein
VLACQLLLLIGITSAKGIWMARIGSTFTADQQFEFVYSDASLPHRILYRTCTPSAQYPKL